MASARDFSPTVSRDTKKAKKTVRRLSARTKWILAGIAGILLIALVWHVAAGLLAGPKKPPPAPPVHVATATKADVTVIDHTIATVVSPAMVQVNDQVAGKLLTAY